MTPEEGVALREANKTMKWASDKPLKMYNIIIHAVVDPTLSEEQMLAAIRDYWESYFMNQVVYKPGEVLTNGQKTKPVKYAEFYGLEFFEQKL